MEKAEYSRIFLNEKWHFWYRANREFSLDLIDRYCRFTTKKHILDTGCGAGGTTAALKKYGHVTGIDMHDQAIELSKNYAIDSLIKASVNKLPFANTNFDLVTSFDVLYHKKVNPSKALAETFRVLKKNGWALIRVPAFEFLRGGHDLVVQTGRRFNISQLIKLTKTAGFNIKYLSYFNLSLFFPALIWRVFNNREGSDVIEIWAPLNVLFYLILKVESKIAQMINLPFGTSVYCLVQKV